MNYFLLFLAIIGTALSLLIGLPYKIIKRVIRLRFKPLFYDLSNIALMLAELLDKMMNVIDAELLNDIAKDDKYKYGNSNDTISFVTAIKWVQGGQGKTIENFGKILDFLDKDHLKISLLNKRDEVDKKDELLKSINY